MNGPRFFKGQVYEWGRFRNTGSHTHTKIIPKLPPRVADIKVYPRSLLSINSQRKDNQSIPPRKKRNGSDLAESESEQAEEFNGQFTDVFSRTAESEVPILERSAASMSDTHVSNKRGRKNDKGLDSFKGFGT